MFSLCLLVLSLRAVSANPLPSQVDQEKSYPLDFDPDEELWPSLPIGSPLPFDPNEEGWPPIDIPPSSFDSFWLRNNTPNNNHLSTGQDNLSNGINLVSGVNETKIDQYLREKVEKMAEEQKATPVFIGRGTNAAALYALSAAYFCPSSYHGYSLSISYNFTEPRKRHIDHSEYDSATLGNETVVSGPYSCMGSVAAFDVQLIRHEYKKADVHMNMDHINEHLKNEWAVFQIERADRSTEWIEKLNDWRKKHSSNRIELPTYNAANSFGGSEKPFVHAIQDLFTKVMNIGIVLRLHSRCSLIRKDLFDYGICREGEEDNERVFWTNYIEKDEDQLSVDLYDVLESILLPIGESVCPTHEVSPSEPHFKSTIFALARDVPSFWEIDETKIRAIRQRFIARSDSNDTSSITAVDRADIRMKRVKMAERQDHITVCAVGDGIYYYYSEKFRGV